GPGGGPRGGQGPTRGGGGAGGGAWRGGQGRGERGEGRERASPRRAHAAGSRLMNAISALSDGSWAWKRRRPVSSKPAAASRRDHSSTGAKWRRSARFTAQGTPSPALKTGGASDTKASMAGVVTSWARRVNEPPGRSSRPTEAMKASRRDGSMWWRPM